ncbi:hypothetical protein Tco_0099940 [Tanacetum coccineum]
MSNTNNNLQTQTSSALHNAIMEAGGKDRPLILAPVPDADATPATPGNDGTPQQPREELMLVQMQWRRGKQLKLICTRNLGSSPHRMVNHLTRITQEWQSCTANPLALIAQQQPIYYPQPNTTHYTQNSSPRSQSVTRKKGKAIANSHPPTYDLKPEVVADDKSFSKEKEIDKLMALISMYFKKIYKTTNNNLKTSLNIRNVNVDKIQDLTEELGTTGRMGSMII